MLCLGHELVTKADREILSADSDLMAGLGNRFPNLTLTDGPLSLAAVRTAVGVRGTDGTGNGEMGKVEGV